MNLICHQEEFGWRFKMLDRRGHPITDFMNKNRRRLEAILSFFLGIFWIIGRGICFVDELFRWMFYWFLKVSLPVRRIAPWMQQIEIDSVYSHILKWIFNTQNKSKETRKTLKWTRKWDLQRWSNFSKASFKSSDKIWGVWTWYLL